MSGNNSVFEKSCAKLVDAIKTNCPKARIASGGMWFSTTLNGVSHVVTSEAEYNHPSNSVFRVIADRIIAALF